MLKMTIDNEEVVSKNDFTIKEEMLSASSTILNNTYPKSWEDDKDYISRFYYPKDYAKLNIQNFSIEPEEAGTTIQVNGSATLTDVDSQKNSRVLSLKGQTSQTTISGINYLPITLPTTTTQNGITLKYDSETGYLSVSGTSTSAVNIAWDFDDVQLPATTYVQYENDFSSANVQILYYSNTSTYLGGLTCNGTNRIYNMSASLGGHTLNRCVFNVANGTTVNGKFRPMITQFSSVQEYEPYVGGVPSPNPQYPQPVNVVSGDNSINVCGKNLLKPIFDTTSLSGLTFTFQNDGILVDGTLTTTYTNVALFNGKLPTGTYTINGMAGGSNSTYQLVLIKNDTTIGYVTTSKFSFSTTDTDTILIRLYCYQNYGRFNNKLFQYQLEIGNQATTYEPYIGSTYPIYLGVENLLPKPSNSSSSSGAGNITLTWDTNNEYKLSGNATSSANINAGYLANDYTIKNGDYLHLCNDSIPSGTIQVVGISSSSTQIFASTISTKNKILDLSSYDGSILRLLRFYCVSGVSVDMKCTPMILNGISKETSYSAYGVQPIELCKIGTYQDYIYKDNGSWYLHKEIGKVVLDGSEDWLIRTDVVQTGYTCFRNGSYVINSRYTDSNITNVYCNYFVVLAQYTGQPMIRIINVTEYGETIMFPSSIASTEANFKAWLSSHNTILYYVLPTPTNTEITDTTLLEQLDALESQ